MAQSELIPFSDPQQPRPCLVPFLRQTAVSVENRFLLNTRVFKAPTDGFTLEFCNGGWAQKTRMMPLPDRAKSVMISGIV